MNPLRKFVSSFVTVTTVLWSMGGALLLPSVAQAATLTPGDLIKASGPAVYYYSADGNRYVFPNEKTYFSWYADFSSVVTITDAELAAILIGGNVTIRPGTKLVKITTDPKTYAVSSRCGMLHWIESETIAEALYGADWNQRIVDVPDAFFVDYEVGSSVSSNVHPNGQLVTVADDSETYVVMDGLKRKLTGSSVADNMLNVADAIETDIVYADGADVTGYEEELGKVSCETGAVVVQGSVMVALASDTPAGKTVPYNSASVPLAKFNLTADSNDSLVTGITFKRVGVGAASDLEAVYLYDGDGVRLTTARTVNSSENTVTYNGLNLSIPANSTKSLVISGDFSASGHAGAEHAFQITDAASVVISGSGSVGGSFPARGNTFTVGVSAATTLTVTAGANPSNPTIGSKNAEIAVFKMAAGTNDVEIRRVALIEGGDSEAQLSNFKLYQGDTLLAQTESLSGKYGDQVVLNLDTAYVLAEGTTKTFTLKADIAGKTNKEIKTYIEEKADVYAIDSLYGVGPAVDVSVYDNGTSEYSTVTTQGGQVTIAQNGPTTGNISKNSSDATFYEFAMTSSDSDLDIRHIRFAVSTTGNDVAELTDVKLVNADTGTVLAGPTTLTLGTGSSTDETILSDSFPLNAGQTLNLKFTADVSNTTAVESDAFTFTLNDFVAGDIKIVDTNENLTDIVPNADIAGNPMTIEASSLALALAGTPPSGVAVRSQSLIPAAGIVFTAGTESDISIKTIVLTGYASTTTMLAGAGTDYITGHVTAKSYFNTVVSSCSLYDGDTLIASKSPSAGVMTFSSLNNVTVTAGTSKTLTVKCQSNAIAATSYFAVGIVTDNTDVTAEDEDGNSVTAASTTDDEVNYAPNVVEQTVYANGTLTIAAGNQPSAAIVLGGTSAQLAQVKATAQYENIRLDRVRVYADTVAKNVTSVSLLRAGEILGSGIISGSNTYVDIMIPGGTVVTKGSTVNLDVYETFANVESGGVGGVDTGATSTGGLYYDVTDTPWTTSYSSKYNVEAVGIASGARLYATASANITGNEMVIRKGKPVVTKLASSSNVLSTGSPADLYKFQINADADGGDVSWIQIVFTVSTSSVATLTSLSNFTFYKGGTQLTAGTDVFITDGNGDSLTGAGVLQGDSTVIVRLAVEDTVSSGGTTYTLRATPTLGATAGGTVTTSFTRDTTASDTGYLYMAAGDTRMGIGNATSSANFLAAGTFLWSDMSDVPHSYATGAVGVVTSNDWTWDVLVNGMNDVNTLSK